MLKKDGSTFIEQIEESDRRGSVQIQSARRLSADLWVYKFI